MLTFLVRRSIGAVLVCLAVTFIVFLIFIVVPGGGPRGTAERIAGKNATTQNVINIEHQWGFDRPFYVQYWQMMKRMFTNSSLRLRDKTERSRVGTAHRKPIGYLELTGGQCPLVGSAHPTSFVR